MLEPIVKTIEVPCGQEKAFKVFVNEMGTWWPLDKRSMSMKGGKPAKSLRIEPKQGGKIVEIGHDDTETMGYNNVFDPVRLDHPGFSHGTACRKRKPC